MKKSIYICVFAVATGLLVSSCTGNKADHSKSKQTSKELTITDKFESIDAFSTTDIEFVQGPAKFTLTAPETVIDQIEVKVENGTLRVGKKNFNDTKGTFKSKLVISYPYVNTFKATGTGDISIKGIDVKNLDLVSAGTGDISVQTGKSVQLTASTAGTGDIDINYFSCVLAELSTNGTGDIDIKRIVADRISGTSNGTGDITVAGECKAAALTSNGVGEVDDSKLEIIPEEEEE